MPAYPISLLCWNPQLETTNRNWSTHERFAEEHQTLPRRSATQHVLTGSLAGSGQQGHRDPPSRVGQRGWRLCRCIRHRYRQRLSRGGRHQGRAPEGQRRWISPGNGRFHPGRTQAHG